MAGKGNRKKLLRGAGRQRGKGFVYIENASSEAAGHESRFKPKVRIIASGGEIHSPICRYLIDRLRDRSILISGPRVVKDVIDNDSRAAIGKRDDIAGEARHAVKGGRERDGRARRNIMR